MTTISDVTRLLLVFLAGCAASSAVYRGRAIPAGTRVVLWTDPGGFAANHHGERTGSVRQIVLHYDAAGSARRCHEVLEARGLSAHFLVDTDGTVYQTLDLDGRAWHAGPANDRSIGIEIANLGAYPEPMEGSVSGEIHGQLLHQRPFTDAQYEALARLVPALCRAFDIPARAPAATTTVLDGALDYEGVLGHYHLTREKVDPGPAFEWDRVLVPD